jgi:hypothetical protein
MTLPELYERVSSLPSAGYLTVDTRFNQGYMYSLIHSARAAVLMERWQKFGKIPPIYYQPFEPEYSVLAQEVGACYVKFYDVPDIIALDGRATGLGFVGANDELCQFREVSNRSAFASMMNNRIMKKGRKPYVLMLGNGEMEIYYKDNIENLRLEAVFSDPTTVPSYNVNTDSYPMDVADMARMEQFLMNGGSLSLSYRTPMDRINDQRDTTVNPQVRQ